MSERRIGILIASSRFPEESKLEDLRFPENDVDGLNEVLTSQNHGQFTQTFVLKNKLHHEILLKINQILRDADRNDLVLIYYSGHGKLNPAGRLHLTSTDTVINALEATSIPVSTIKDYVDISSSNKIVLILDCCFSGAAGEAFARSGVDDQLQLVSGGRGTYILTASTGIQVAQEKESDQYGVFTKYLIEGIKSGEADLDSDGRITMGDLYRYVHDKVLDEGFQEPMKWDLNVRGELVIARSGKTPRKERAKQIREIIFELAKKGFLPDDILDKARQVIAHEQDQLAGEDRTYDRLLDQLLKKRLEPGEFIRKWDRVRRRQEQERKLREEEQRKAAEERQRLEEEKQRLAEQKQTFEEEQKRKAEEERKRTEAEAERKAEEKRKKKEIEAKRREEKAKIKPDKPEPLKIKPSKPKPDIKAPTEPKSSQPISTKPRKESNALIFGVVASVIILLMTGGWFYYKYQQEKQEKETRIKIERFYEQIEELERSAAKVDIQEQLKGFYRQRDTLSNQVEGLSEQATKAGMESQLEQLQDRLKQLQIQLANKEKEFIEVRQEIVKLSRQILNLEHAVAKIDNPEQIEELYRQRDTLSQQVEGFSEQAAKAGWLLEMEELQERLKQVQIQLANKEKELFTTRGGRIFVESVPDNATVKILNINQRFQQGMELDPGDYHVEVAAEGYETERRWIELVAGHKEPFSFELAPQKVITNSIGMKFMLIPAGSFTMGSQISPEEVAKSYGGDAKYYKDEQPPHHVEITKPFYMQTTEITQGQWKRIMGDNPSNFKDCGDDCPVDNVSWDDAQQFISKLNQMENTNKYRLPTEAEWEYACRAGTATVFSFGNEVDKLGEYAWYSDNSGGKTKPVGKKWPNAWGLYDMHGNVWEWCQNWYDDYPSNSVADAKGPDKDKYRVLRGGSWYYNAWNLRSAIRHWDFPDSRHYNIGFRVARAF